MNIERNRPIFLDHQIERAQFVAMTSSHFKASDSRANFAAITKAYVGALVAVAVATIAGLLIAQRWGNQPVVLIFILPVLGIAIHRGLWPAIFAAIASTLAYNFYFTEPYRTLLIHSPTDIVTVVALFLVAIVTSRLASQVREQANIAATHASRNAMIAGFARQLLSCANEGEINRVTVRALADLFSCNTVLVVGDDSPRLAASSAETVLLAPTDLAAAALTLASGKPAGRGVQRPNLIDWHFRPIASDQKVLAAIGLAREDGHEPVSEEHNALLENMLDQTALALERARVEGEAREVVKLRERDGIRSSLLGSIGQEIKPRLHAINSTVRELRRTGSAEKPLISRLTAETAGLERYIENLVELEPGLEQPPVEIGDLTIDLRQRIVRKAQTDVHLSPKEFALLAELVNHRGRVLGHAHLLRAIWGPAHSEQIDYLRVAVRSLRVKLEDDPSKPVLILNEPSIGYRLAGF